jgi:hypothetical protein
MPMIGCVASIRMHQAKKKRAIPTRLSDTRHSPMVMLLEFAPLIVFTTEDLWGVRNTSFLLSSSLAGGWNCSPAFGFHLIACIKSSLRGNPSIIIRLLTPTLSRYIP